MHRLIALCLLCLLSIGSVFAKEPEPEITKEIALKAIERFRAEPESEMGRGCAAIIVRFAEASPDVKITLSAKTTPWISDKKTDKRRGALLLGAFVAGNMRAQFERGVAEDQSFAGVEQVIATYRQMQKSTPAFRLASVEKLITLQKDGKLAEYLAAK